LLASAYRQWGKQGGIVYQKNLLVVLVQQNVSATFCHKSSNGNISPTARFNDLPPTPDLSIPDSGKIESISFDVD
jgi:hypothetical protein